MDRYDFALIVMACASISCGLSSVMLALDGGPPFLWVAGAGAMGCGGLIGAAAIFGLGKRVK